MHSAIFWQPCFLSFTDWKSLKTVSIFRIAPIIFIYDVRVGFILSISFLWVYRMHLAQNIYFFKSEKWNWIFVSNNKPKNCNKIKHKQNFRIALSWWCFKIFVVQKIKIIHSIPIIDSPIIDIVMKKKLRARKNTHIIFIIFHKKTKTKNYFFLYLLN